ncbi:MAG: GldG family protein [bacterium]
MKTAIGIIGTLLIIVGLLIRLITTTWNVLGISIAAIGILLVILWGVINRHRFKEGSWLKRLFYSFNFIILVLVVLGLITIINYVSNEYYHRWDLTSNKQFTLSKETDNVLKQLKHELKITAFFQEGTGGNIRDLLSEYAYVNRNVHYTVIDPDKEPTIAKDFGINTNGTIVIQYEGKTIKTEQANENGITNAIIKILRKRVINVCYLTGNGERALSDTTGVDGFGDFKQALLDQDYKVDEILLPSVGSIPSSCTMVVDAGATKPFLPSEIDALKTYIQDGGYLLLMIDPRTDSGLEQLLSSYGIKVGNNVVLDEVVRLFQGPTLGVEPIVTNYSNTSDITKDFKGTTVFPLVRTVEVAKEHNANINIVPIAMTSKTSWADTDLKDLFEKGIAKFGPTSIKGPVSVAVAGTIKSGDRIARIAVFGTSKIATNKYLNALFNRDFVMNTVSWLVKEENLITIRPKPNLNNQPMFLTAKQGNIIFYLTVVLIPLILFFGGILAYLRMKRL